jgi:HlyD family secretion protein
MIKKIFKFFLLFLLVAIFGWTIYFLYAKSQKPPEVFKTQSASVNTIIKKTVATGSVLPRKEVFMKSQVSGIIEKIYVLAGDKIKEGEVIARIKIIPNMVELNNAENRLSQATINVENAQKDYDRNAQLAKDKVIPQADFQQFELRLSAAKQELDAASDNLSLIKEGVTKKTGQVTNTLIRSTISGMILDVPVKEGNSVIESNTFNEGTTIASVADMGEMIFEGKVDESEVGKLHQNIDLILTVGAIENEKFNAKLEYISPKGVTENGAIQFQIRAAIAPDNNHFLRAGYSANADIILARKDSVLSVPESLLQFSGDSAFVEVETTPGFFKKQYVKTGLSDGINIEVLDGVTLKDKIKSPAMLDEKLAGNN